MIFVASGSVALADSYLEVDLVGRLQTEAEKQRGQIHRLEATASELRSDNDELRGENERLTGCNRDLRRKCRAAQAQLHEMIDERAQITAKVNT